MIDPFRIAFHGVSKRFGHNLVLDNASLILASHDCVVLTGENGSGKTTLLRIVAGLEKPAQCDVLVDNTGPEPWRRQRKRLLRSIMYLHQQPYMLSGSLRRNIEYAARLNPSLVDRESAVNRALIWAGLESLQNQSAASLSGGQKQRVALARARLSGPQILLLDEPTANLDSESRARTLQMLSEFRDSGTAIVVVTHDPASFAGLATRQLRLENRRVHPVGKGAAEVVDLDSVRHSHKR